MRERGLEFKVGLLMLIATGILVGFIFILGNFSLRSGFELRLDYDYIGSLQPGAPVKVSGIKVGKVKSIDFIGGAMDPEINQRVQVRVTVWVEDRVKDSIRSDAEFFINTAGVLGEQYLEVVPGKNWDKPPIAANTIIHDEHFVHNPPRTDLVVARLYEVLDGVASVLRDDREAIKHLLSNSASAIAEINTLLVENKQGIGDLIASAGGLAAEGKTTLAKVNAGLGDGRPVANLLSSADGLMGAAKTSLTTLTPAAAAFMTDATRVTGLVTDQRLTSVDKALDSAGLAVGRAATLLDNTNGVVVDIRAGKGTIGSLLSRDELYSDIRELLRDLKRNPWKFFWKE